jgi:hypothetical protein
MGIVVLTQPSKHVRPVPHRPISQQTRTVAHACFMLLKDQTPTSTLTATDSEGRVLKTTETDNIYRSGIVTVSNVPYTESPPADASTMTTP